MMDQGERPYKCVNCGDLVPYLFKRYSPSVLKLKNCEACQKVADKYIEYDKVIIMIDMVLLNKQAYRHILFNSSFENHWKLAVVLVLLEICMEWVAVNKLDQSNSIKQSDTFEVDRQFYLSCLNILTGFTSWWLSVYALSIYICSLHYSDAVKLWKAMVLASCSKFLVVSQLIWGEVDSSLHSSLITVYTCLSQIQALNGEFKALLCIFLT
ncbi:Uncharacterized protein GBIM_04429 [Gryllus bimaculatus]|nr:Uncharacterized protein GBIM_04429 [Gryllus bimaculatus]